MSGSNDSSIEIYKGTPFQSPLIESGFGSPARLEDIRALKSDPDKIVRVDTIRAKHYKSQFQRLVIHRNILNTLRERYKLDVLDVDFIFGPGDNTEHIRTYLVTDRVHGKVLRDKVFRPDEIPSVREKIDDLFSKMVQYYWDVSREGGWYNDDLAQSNSQFVWGRKRGDKKDKIYLVDVGVRLEQHKLDDVSYSHLLGRIYIDYPGGQGVFNDIIALERIHNFRLSRAREKLGQFLGDLLSRGVLGKWEIRRVENLKKWVESKDQL